MRAVAFGLWAGGMIGWFTGHYAEAATIFGAACFTLLWHIEMRLDKKEAP